MNARRVAATLAYAAALVLLVTAVLHIGALAAASSQVASDIKPLFAMLWLFFGVALAVTGVLVAAVAQASVARRGIVLAIASLFPFAGAALMTAFLGFLAPAILLLVGGALVMASAILGRTRRQA